MCKCLVLPLNLCLASIETSSHPGPCYKKHSALSILVEVTAMLSYPLSPASLSHTHTTPLFNIRILLCIMNHPQSFSVITVIAISFRLLYLGKLKRGNLYKLISEYH